MIPNKPKYDKLRIFVASPADVQTERCRIRTVIDEFNQTGGIADYLHLNLDVLDWRTHVAPYMGRPEDVVLNQLPVEMWDVFIGIIWLRFGTPSGALDSATGKQFQSGTQEEFSLAYSAWKRMERPQILFYRCRRFPESWNDIDSEELKRVDAFFKQFGPDADHPGLYKEFHTAEDFERQVRQDLTKLLLRYGKDVLKKEPPGALVEFAATKIVDTLPRRAPFVGRKQEISQAMRALDPNDRSWGLLIDGIGGIGKTALATEVAYICKEKGLFDLTVFVTAKQEQLDISGIRPTESGIRTLDDIVNETARALGQSGILYLTGDSKRRALMDALRNKRVLLIWDNLETLTEDEQRTISDYLRSLPQKCKAIVTSRKRLGESAVFLRLDKLDWEDAKDLIRDQINRHGEGLRALAHAKEDIWKQIYEDAGGSPLAILWIIGLLRERRIGLETALTLLHDGNTSLDLTNFIYSEAWKRLGEEERLALRALASFDGFATFEALMAVTHLSQPKLESLLPKLYGLSLVDILESVDERGIFRKSYTLHPLTRRFVRKDLQSDASVYGPLGLSFSQYWLDYTKRYSDRDTEMGIASSCIETEWSNIFSASAWLYSTAFRDGLLKDVSAAKNLVFLAKYLRQYVEVGGHRNEKMQLQTWAYEAAAALSQWNDAGWCAYYAVWIKLICNDQMDVEEWAKKCSRAWEQVGSKREIAFAKRICGLIAERRGDFNLAFTLLGEALAIWLDLGLESDMSIALSDLAGMSSRQGKIEGAKAYYLEVLKIAEKKKDRNKQAISCANLGSLAVSRGYWAEASGWLDRAMNLAREIGALELIASVEVERSRVWKALERPDLALESARAALTIYERLNHNGLAQVQSLIGSLEQELSIPRLSD